ncbi:MAG: undecaprenyl-phosphate glucose phosphotransferase, partial [Tannerellaceae bacterium]|nr:undecaprenyl-phosphate glucose phosphotransferase [Tannerellaceae bacterium]
MESNKKRGYLIQWFVGTGDLLVVNALFFVVYYLLGDNYAQAIYPKLREVILLLNFCYFFSVYFVPVQLHKSVVFLEKIVQRALLMVTFLVIFFATCLMFLNIGDQLATFLLCYYFSLVVVFSLWRIIVRITLKIYRKKGYNFKRVIIVGAGKNGMELFRIMREELAYGFNVMGFFDDNPALKDVLPNYLGMTYEVERFVL